MYYLEETTLTSLLFLRHAQHLKVLLFLQSPHYHLTYIYLSVCSNENASSTRAETCFIHCYIPNI